MALKKEEKKEENKEEKKEKVSKSDKPEKTEKVHVHRAPKEEKEVNEKELEETVEEKVEVKERKHSKRIPSSVSPSWVEYKPKEISDVIVTLANQGNSSSEIGMILRDQYGIPNVRALISKSVDDILRESNILPQIPDDLMSLIRKSVQLKSHMEKNKKDFSAKHGYILTVSKIRKLVKYYLVRKRLPKGWRFSEETAALLVK